MQQKQFKKMANPDYKLKIDCILKLKQLKMSKSA